MTDVPAPANFDDIAGDVLILVLDIASGPAPTFWHDRGESCLGCRTFRMGGWSNRPITSHPIDCYWRRARELADRLDQVR